MITIDNVTFAYMNAKNPILKNFSLKIKEGEFVGIIGPTGSGKSTICYLFNGLIPNYFKGNFMGSVSINNMNVSEKSVESMSEILGYMLQEPSFQIASPFVESEITFGMENFAISYEKMDERLTAILEKLGIDYLRYRSTSSLSEGEKQKVVLASILVMDPSILILDESSSMVDSTSKKELGEILTKVNQEEGKTIVIIDHDLDFIAKVTKRVILINNGEIIADGSPSEILTNSLLLQENGLTPPTLTTIFQLLIKKNISFEKIPTSFSEAFVKLKELLP